MGDKTTAWKWIRVLGVPVLHSSSEKTAPRLLPVVLARAQLKPEAKPSQALPGQAELGPDILKPRLRAQLCILKAWAEPSSPGFVQSLLEVD